MAESTISVVGTPMDDQSMEDLRRNPGVHASDENMTSAGSHPQPQSSSTARRRSISPPSPELYLPKRDPTSSNIDASNRTLGPGGSNNHFAGSSTATPTDPEIPEHVKQYFSSLSPGQFHRAVERMRNDNEGSSSSSRSRPRAISDLDSTNTETNDQTSSSNPTTATQLHPSQRRSDHAGLSVPHAVRPNQDISTFNGEAESAIFDHKLHDRNGEERDELEALKDFDEKELDEFAFDPNDEILVNAAVDNFVVQKESNANPSSDDAVELGRMETHALYNSRLGRIRSTAYPAATYRPVVFPPEQGPVLRRTIASVVGMIHMALFWVVINALHYIRTKGERVCLRTLCYRIKKALLDTTVKSSYYAILMVIKEICLTLVVDRDRLNIDAQSKGIFYGDMEIIVKAPTGIGTQVIRGRALQPTAIPPASVMIAVRLGKLTKRVLGLETVGPLSRGRFLPWLTRNAKAIIVVTKGFADRNTLRLLALITEAKVTAKLVKVPSLWIGDGNGYSFRIFSILKYGQQARAYENSKLVMNDMQNLGLYAEDVQMAPAEEQCAHNQRQIQSLQGIIEKPGPIGDLVPAAENLLKLGYCIEADNLEEPALRDIVHRGDRYVESPPPPALVEDIHLRPAHTIQDVASIPLLDFIILPPMPDQPDGALYCRFQVRGCEDTYGSREFLICPDGTITVLPTRNYAKRHLSVQDLAKLEDLGDMEIVCLRLRFSCWDAMAGRSLNPVFKEGIADDTNFLVQVARAFYPDEFPLDGQPSALLRAKAEWRKYCLLTVRLTDELTCSKTHDVCLACGTSYAHAESLSGNGSSHYVRHLECARAVAKIRPEHAPEADATNTEPHWCRIGSCKKKKPLASAQEYDIHWLTHRVHCEHCGKTFPDENQRETHETDCPKKPKQATFRRPRRVAKPKNSCGGCGKEVANVNEHLACSITCARAIAHNQNTNQYQCGIHGCRDKKTAFSLDEYDDHWYSAHRELCPKCGANFLNADKLKKHKNKCKRATG